MMQVKQWRKRPVVIEAARLPEGDPSAIRIPTEVAEIAEWCGGELQSSGPIDWNGGIVYSWQLVIPTLERRMYAKAGDYIIKGVAGEFYPCESNIFAKTYEAVRENDNTRYRMIDFAGKAHWLTLHECARALDGGWGDGKYALDLDTMTERPLTKEEAFRITDLADEYSGDK